MHAVLQHATALVGRLAARSEPQLAAISARLDVAVRSLTEATDWIVKISVEDPPQMAASAVPFLMLAGTTLGGYLMAQASLIAAQSLASNKADADFHRAKLRTAHFYAEHCLAFAPSAARTVMSGGAATLAVSETDF